MRNLKKLRTSRHLSQLKLAELFHISQQSAWKYENDPAQPGLGLIAAFTNYFDTSIDYLAGNTNNPRRYKTLSETKLSEEELAHLRLYRALVLEVRKLSRQTMQLYFGMQNGSEKE